MKLEPAGVYILFCAFDVCLQEMTLHMQKAAPHLCSDSDAWMGKQSYRLPEVIPSPFPFSFTQNCQKREHYSNY